MSSTTSVNYEKQAERIWEAVRRGRPTKLSPKMAAKILTLVLEGNYKHTASAACGISKYTLDRWMARGAEYLSAESDGPVPDSERIYVDFCAAMEWAESRSEITLLRRVAAASGRWSAYMTILERRWPGRWGRSDKRLHEVTGAGGKPVAFELKSNEERQKEVASILKTAGALDDG